MSALLSSGRLVGYSAVEVGVGMGISMLFDKVLPYEEIDIGNIDKYSLGKDVAHIVLQASTTMFLAWESRKLLLGEVEDNPEFEAPGFLMMQVGLSSPHFWSKVERVKKAIVIGLATYGGNKSSEEEDTESKYE